MARFRGLRLKSFRDRSSKRTTEWVSSADLHSHTRPDVLVDPKTDAGWTLPAEIPLGSISEPRNMLDLGTAAWAKLLSSGMGLGDYKPRVKTATSVETPQAEASIDENYVLIPHRDPYTSAAAWKALSATTAGPKTIPTPEPATTFPLMDLPTELVVKIIGHAMTHHHALAITPRFETLPRHDKSPLNYSIAHTSQAAYCIGLPFYYQLNTFSIDLGELKIFPATAGTWHTDYLAAVRYVKYVRVTARQCQNWEDAFGVLKRFAALEEITFDMRDEMGCLGRIEADPKGDIELFKKRKRAGEALLALMLAGGVGMGSVEAVWVVDDGNPVIGPEQWLVGKLTDGLDKW